jgi:hypothetical protein
METFPIVLGLLLIFLIILLFYNRKSEHFKVCKKKQKGFFARLLAYLDSLFNPKTITVSATNKLNNSFTVPVDERNNLMRNEGKNYYWSWA